MAQALGPARMKVFLAMLDEAAKPHSNDIFNLPMTNWDHGLPDAETGPEDQADYVFQLGLSPVDGNNLQAWVNILPAADLQPDAAADLPQIGFGFEVNRGLPVAMAYEDPLGGDVVFTAIGVPAKAAGEGARMLVNLAEEVDVRRDDALLSSLSNPEGRIPLSDRILSSQ